LFCLRALNEAKEIDDIDTKDNHVKVEVLEGVDIVWPFVLRH